MSKFLQTEVGWNPQSGEINIATPSERKTIEKLSTVESTSESKSLRIQSISEADKKELVAFAKNFLGVPYDFGAGSYEETKKFDCSSFTRHVFKKFGVSLPRLAKDQDNLGTRVSRSELDVGDLIFLPFPADLKVMLYLVMSVFILETESLSTLGVNPEFRSVTSTQVIGVM